MNCCKGFVTHRIIMLLLLISSISFADSYKNNLGDRYITIDPDFEEGIIMFSITKTNNTSNTGHEHLIGGYASHKKEFDTDKTDLMFIVTAYFDENEQCRIAFRIEAQAQQWIKILINSDKCDRLDIPNETIFYKQ